MASLALLHSRPSCRDSSRVMTVTPRPRQVLEKKQEATFAPLVEEEEVIVCGNRRSNQSLGTASVMQSSYSLVPRPSSFIRHAK